MAELSEPATYTSMDYESCGALSKGEKLLPRSVAYKLFGFRRPLTRSRRTRLVPAKRTPSYPTRRPRRRGEVLTIRGATGRADEAVLLFERASVVFREKAPMSPAEELLSPKQRMVAWLATSGMPLREVAEALDLSAETAKTHIKSVYDRLRVSKRSSLAHLLRS